MGALIKRMPQRVRVRRLVRLEVREMGKPTIRTRKGIRGRPQETPTNRRPYRGISPFTHPESEASCYHMLVPEQCFMVAHHYATQWSGARRLLLAVLQDAVSCWFRYLHARNVRERQLFQEIQSWFWAKDREWLFAFERICEHLELDPDYIRRGLTSWHTFRPSRQTPLMRVESMPSPRHFSRARM